ncbi:hypothetical protein C0585_05515 [Candidatus Woesearchaeota archaeon]|nr:MAG: hypothetical protein C0585_05515 [Candidatus Woesearchaeota archaeon]
MVISSIFVWTYNGIIILLLGIFGSRLIIKTYEHIRDSQTHYDYTEEEKMHESTEMFLEELRKTARHFWISFYVVELSLIAFFIFWDLMFFYNVNII